jgi:hypothetical protein
MVLKQDFQNKLILGAYAWFDLEINVVVGQTVKENDNLTF